MSDNLDNLLGDIYSSSSQSQGVKELANLINNLSQLLLKAISQLEQRVAKLEQQSGRPVRAVQPMAPSPGPTTPAPMPKVASPFSAPKAPKSTPPPPPPPQTSRAATPAPTQKPAGPGSVAEAASMLGVTLKKTPSSTPSAPASTSSDSSPSFLTSTVNPDAPAATADTGLAQQPDAVAPASTGVAAPGGGFRGELAEKLAKRRQAVQQQIEDDFDAPDLVVTPDAEIPEEPVESTSSELKIDLEDELRNAFSKLKE